MSLPTEVTPAERKVIWAIGLSLIVSTAFFTILHHGFPQVFNVPPNDGIPFTSLPIMFVLDLIPIVLAWLGVVASVLLVVGLPLQLAGFLRGPVTSLMWLPMLAFEVPLALWLLVRGVAMPARTPSA